DAPARAGKSLSRPSSPLAGASGSRPRSLHNLANPHIAKLDPPAVVLQAHVAAERFVFDLVDRALIHVDDLLAIDGDADDRTNALDGHGVPLGRGLDRVGAGGDVAVQRAARLLAGRLAGVVHELDLVARIGGAARLRLLRIERHGANADAAVALGRHAVFDVEREVGELLLAVAQEAKALAVADKESVADAPHRAIVAVLVLEVLGALDDPAVEVSAVEQVGGLVSAAGQKHQQARGRTHGPPQSIV